jgi:hypothetical protein
MAPKIGSSRIILAGDATKEWKAAPFAARYRPGISLGGVALDIPAVHALPFGGLECGEKLPGFYVS